MQHVMTPGKVGVKGHGLGSHCPSPDRSVTDKLPICDLFHTFPFLPIASSSTFSTGRLSRARAVQASAASLGLWRAGR